MTFLHFGMGVLALLVAWYAFWQYHCRKLQTSGHVAPQTSLFAKLFWVGACKLTAFLTIGPVKVVGKDNSPRCGRVVYVANHQVPADFAMLAAGSRRHYRALGDAAQFTGFFGVLAAWVGIVSVTFKTKEDRAAGEAAAVNVLSARHSGWRIKYCEGLASVGLMLLFAGYCYMFSDPLCAGIFAALAVWMLCMPGGDASLAVAPQGALMPDNVLKREEFRAGCVRIARAAAQKTGEPVYMVPMGIRYKRDPKDAHWTHRFLKRTRSIFLGLRNPRHWDPLFKLNLDELTAGRRAEVEQHRKSALAAYYSSHITIYGGVVVVGKPIEISSLPEDPMEAIEQVRLAIAALCDEAEKH